MNSAYVLEILEDACFQKYLELVHALTGITMRTNRKVMLQGRLRNRIGKLGLRTYDAYLEVLKESREEKVVFIDLITTNETYFLRTPRIWSHLSEKFLSQWYQSNEGKTFEAWSAATASGEEAYSLGVVLQAFKEKHPRFDYQVLGSDISREMVDRSRSGTYQGRSIEAFNRNYPSLFHKYLTPCGDSRFQVIPQIKSRSSFSEHNLFNPLAGKKVFDLVLLRNVLIYFKALDQEKVLKLIRPRLSAKGILVIGEAESLMHIDSGYSLVQPLVYKKTTTERLESVPALSEAL